MYAAAVDCPKCGASMGPADARGERVCSYCGQRVAAVAGALSPEQVELRRRLQASLELGQFPRSTENQARVAGALEVKQRAIQGIDDAKRLNSIVCVGLGVLFGLFGLACLGGVVITLMGADSLGAAAGVGVFGLFWFALALLLGAIGWSGLGKLNRKKRLMASGLRGTARVVSYTESNWRVDGATVFSLNLEISVPGRPPFGLSIKEAVPRSSSVYTNALLPAFVDPADPKAVVIDWWA